MGFSALYITDADFADDIAPLSDNLAGAQALLSSLESIANCAGLHLNESKTEFMPINVHNNQEIRTLSNTGLTGFQSSNIVHTPFLNGDRNFRKWP